MKNIPHSPALFSYPEALVLLYLYHHTHLIIPSYLIELENLKKLSFISVLYGSNLFQETPSLISSKLTKKYSSLLAKYAVPKNGYCLIKKDHKQYIQFMEQYVNDYKNGLFMQNPFNFFSFSHSWEHFVSLIHKNQEKYGDVFLLENQPNLPAIRDLSNSVRWPECVFWALLNEKMEMKSIQINFARKAASPNGEERLCHISDQDILDIPTISLEIAILKSIRNSPHSSWEYCGIEIREEKQIIDEETIPVFKVFYKGHPIPFKGFSAQLCLLIFLVKHRGANQKIQTFIQALNEWYKTHKNHLKWENNKNILDNLENYRSEILNKFHRACDTYQTSIDFKITVGKKGLRLYPSSSNSSKST